MLTDYRHLPRWLVAIATCCAIVISMAVINPSAYAEETNTTAITDSAAATNENKSTDTVTLDRALSGRRASRASRAASKAPNLPIYDLDGTTTHLNQEYANTYRVALIAPAGQYYLNQALDSALQLSKKKLYKDVRFFALDYDSDRSSFSQYASQETSNVRFASSADTSNKDYLYFAWDSYQTFNPDSYQASWPFIVLIDKDNNLVGCETGSQSLNSLIEEYFHISDGSVKNSSVTGTYLGPGTTVYAVDTLHQSSVYQAALKKVAQWRQDALNDSRIKVRYYNPETGYIYFVSIADYLKASNISQEQYLSPGWSNSLEKIAIQRSIEAYDVDLAHTRPDGNSCFEATVGEDSSSGEILAWGISDIASAIDLWASEKDDYIHFLNGESYGQYGHYEELINPDFQYYGFAGSSAAYYGTVFAGEASDSALGGSSPTNLDGTFTFEVNMSDEHMDQGVTWNAPDTMIAGTSKAASVKLKYANGRYELRGTWTSSNPSVISVDDNGTLHAKAPGTATITVNRQSYSFSKQITVTLSTISFSGNGATSGFMESIQGAIGQSATIPNVGFSRTGYTFTGWNTSPDGTGTAYRPNATIQFAAQNITLYAQWKVRSYSVNFDSNGGSAVASQSVKYGSKASRPTDPTRAGHTFQGWYTSRDGGARYDFNQTVTGDVTLYAHWSVNSYTLAFDGNGGKASESSRTVQYGSQYGSLPTATRTGYAFQGWYTARSGGSQVSSSTTMEAANTTVYAHWTVNTYTVSFDSNGGSAVASQSVRYGSKATQPANPTRAGHTFQGWYTARSGGSKYDFGTAVTGDVTLYAHWSVNSYTLTFDGNGGKPSEASRTVAYGGQYGSLPTATRTGYAFQGWYTARDGGTKVSPSTTMGAADTTLYARWSVNSYTVSFDSDGGSNVPAQKVRYGSKASRPADPTRAGHTFQGWYTSRDGGSKYDFGTAVTGDVTLHAHWAKEPAALRRLSGATRYDTMERIVGAGGWRSGGTVIVASGGNYPDALAASGLAGVLDAPIVLTDGNTLSVQASARLTSLAPSRIIVAGGRAAVSDGVVAALRGICPDVERVAGETRVDTSLELYRKGSGWGSTAILATSGNFADALSVSSYAYAAKAPVFLVDPGTGLTRAQKAALGTFGQVLVVGGENAVPSRHVAGLPGVTRLSGATRYETSERIAEWTTGHGLGMDGVVYATGANFPDALAAGPLAGRAGAVTLLVADAHSPAVSFSADYRGKVDRAYVVGGENAVSRATADAIADGLGLKHAQ
ncbi:InlB B-repeat-containing protein [Bifidobacterium adolescentis]|uniref:InlB B-repeat-containing protein n=1 Tax=Bifidobacterium adolescentis TaxID=1680 RepID=UPI0034A4761C